MATAIVNITLPTTDVVCEFTLEFDRSDRYCFDISQVRHNEIDITEVWNGINEATNIGKSMYNDFCEAIDDYLVGEAEHLDDMRYDQMKLEEDNRYF